MTPLTIERLHEDLVSIKKELKYLRFLVAEEYELNDDVIHDIQKSRKRAKLISHEEMRKEFG